MTREYPEALPAGYRLEEFEIVRVLGQGGFAITYLVRDGNLDQQVALKEYFPTDYATRTDRVQVTPRTSRRARFDWGYRRFRDEARVLTGFRHPNVVASRRYFRANGTAYLALDYVEGESLAAILGARGTLSLSTWRPWLDSLLAGLEHIHSCGFLHRDITPRNIVIRAEDDRPVLIDLGAARIAAGDHPRTVVLVPGYAPIEQHSERAKQGPFTDNYSVAAVTYRVLTGELPPSAQDRAIEDAYEPLEERFPDASPWMAAVDRALARAARDRPQTAASWRRDLNAAAARMWMEVPSDAAEAPDAHGQTPLHRAAAEELVAAVVARLIDGGANVDASDGWGDTPLHAAARHNRNPEVAAILLDRGADVHYENSLGGTPLHAAAWSNENPKVLSLLLDRGADVRAQDAAGDTPLHYAAGGNRNSEVLALLLDRGADVHAQNSSGDAPLRVALRNENLAMMEEEQRRRFLSKLGIGGDP